MVQERLKADLKKLVNSPLVGKVTKQWGEYEGRVLKLVKEFDVKSRDARKQSRKRLDQFTVQLKKTRGDVEKKVSTLLNKEGKALNKRVNELLNYLKSMANSEKITRKASTSAKKKTSKAKASAKKGTRGRRAKSGNGAETSAHLN